MSATTTFTPPIRCGIVAYIAVGRKPFNQRERIEAALAALGLQATEIVEEDTALTMERGRYGIGRIRELAASSAVDALVVASYDVLFNTASLIERFRRDMAKCGVCVMALE